MKGTWAGFKRRAFTFLGSRADCYTVALFSTMVSHVASVLQRVGKVLNLSRTVSVYHSGP